MWAGPVSGDTFFVRELVSIVVPCFNEEEVLPQTIPSLTQLCDSLPQYDFEIVFVDDGSCDATFERLRDATRQAQALARDTYAEGSNRAMALRDEVETGIRRHPGLAIAGALGGGVLLGMLLSRRR